MKNTSLKVVNRKIFDREKIQNIHLAKEEKENTNPKTSEFLTKIINQGFQIFNHFTDAS
jgi:hypothetical protein